MDTPQCFTREAFDAIVAGCQAVIEKHGFTQTSQNPVRVNQKIENIFEESCFVGWFGDVAKRQEAPPTQKRETNLTLRQLNHITMECALVFMENGIPDVCYNESLNGIRGTIMEVLGEMGYTQPNSVRHHSLENIWGCYKFFEELARRNGRSDEEIFISRKWYQENRAEHYEA